MKTKVNLKKLMSNHGFSLIELVVAVAIFLAMFGGVFMSMSAGQNSWALTSTQIDLQENLRLTMGRISKELRESGSDSTGAMQVTILDNSGANSSDILRFSMPVLCETTATIINASSDVANWGAPLTFGCTDSTCMDADDDCSTVDYSYVEYAINNSNQLERRVRDSADVVVRTDVFAQNITNFQTVLSGDQNVVTLTVTATANTTNNRTVTSTDSLDVLLRNRG